MAEAWTIRIFKAYGGRTADKLWSNTYHVSAEQPLTDPGWTALVEAIGARERMLHNPQVNFMRATISSTTREGGYNPEDLKVYELGTVGERGVQSGEIALPLDLALKVKKNVAFGRSGTMFYRGVLHSGDVSVGAGGDATLIVPGDGNLLNNVGLLPSSIQDELTALGGFLIMPPRVTVPGGPAQTVRTIDSFALSGVSVNRRNHRYFDKAASDDGVGVGT